MSGCEQNIVSDCDRVSDKSLIGNRTTFSQIQASVFNPNCVSCHSGTTPSGGLDLSNDVAYNNLVNEPVNTSEYVRVLPFDSDSSYLYLTLVGDNAPLMPPSGPLSDAKIDSVAAWIDRGAPND
ncbi:MAG: c-type cytochrome domain-containing protein [candidate division KSB1 bacterium]|nr:c-type cytochrome domain-containing protein [candidate division KSB1 bacterium]